MGTMLPQMAKPPSEKTPKQTQRGWNRAQRQADNLDFLVHPWLAFLKRHWSGIAFIAAAAMVALLVFGSISLLQPIERDKSVVAPTAAVPDEVLEVEPETGRDEQVDVSESQNLAVAFAIAHERITRAVPEPRTVHVEPRRDRDRERRRRNRPHREPPQPRFEHEPPPGLFGSAPVDRGP